MDVTANNLVELASRLRPEDIGDAAKHAAKRSIIDAIGCAFGAFNEEPLRVARNFAASRHGVPAASVMGTRSQTAPEIAALVNGAMIRYLDFSDDYFGGTGDFGPHPSDNLGGVMAATESTEQGGRELILATIIAYEIVGAFVDAIDLRGRPRIWDYPVFHAMATALAASRLMGLSPVEMHHALGLAVVPNFSLNRTRSGELSNWKAFAGPNGSSRGLFAALLAKEGLTGPPEPVEGSNGLLTQLDQSFTIDDLGSGNGPYRIERTFYKSMPVRYTIQLPVAVALSLRDRLVIEDIASLQVYIARRFAVSRADHPEYWDPRTRETADHSPPYLVAAALVDGGVTPSTFTADRYRDETILRLMGKIELVEDSAATAAFPGSFQVRVAAILKSGEMLSAEGINPKGHPANPMSDLEISSKFLQQVAPLLGEDRSSHLVATLWELDQVADMPSLFSLMEVR